MSLRLIKLVIPLDKIDGFVEFSLPKVKFLLKDFTKPNGVRFFQASNSPLTFFLNVWWNSSEDARRFDKSTGAKKLVEGVQEFLAERLVTWDLDFIDDDFSEVKPAFFDHKVFIRLSKISVSPSKSTALISFFKSYSNVVIRNQPGCLSVKLLKSGKVLDAYFIISIWSRTSDFDRFVKSEKYAEMRENTLSILERRVEIWNLNLIASKNEINKVLGVVIER